jgi:hypothetical protein
MGILMKSLANYGNGMIHQRKKEWQAIELYYFCLFFPPVDFLLVLQRFKTTAKTYSIMATDYSTTIRTFPLFPLFLQKFFYTLLFDEIKIVNKAHVEKSAISLVKMFQVLTGKISAFITVFHLVIQ